MRLPLRDFQTDAVDELMLKLDTARFGASKKQPQAVVLSSPTGSGKTVMAAEMIERILRGSEGNAADPRAVFLWLSDLPAVNEQSRAKLEDASDVIPPDRLVTILHPFNVERLAPGRVYFLNTQKLTAASLLTQRGDKQQRTIWEIIENTAKAAPTSFYLIIDEAHRGMRDADKSQSARTRSENVRMTTVQKFVRGDKTLGLSPVPLIVGISATPDRFNKVLEQSGRTAHPVDVPPEKVRGSGLIKDRIKLSTAEKGDEADWSMLAEAGRKWGQYSTEWEKYCSANGIDSPVRPVLVVQVENGNEKETTKTDLALCVKVLRDAGVVLPPEGYAHCFEHDADEPAGMVTLRKIDASEIDADPDVRVVFFKTALTTGWDCPRAEVMMSFRKAVDDTLIAQLVGRMVRTPLTRKVEGNDFLNGVSLALPHYDDAAVAAILKKLQDPESGAVGEAVDEKEMALYHRATDKADLFAALASVPTYSVERPRKRAHTWRVMELASMLSEIPLGDALFGTTKAFVVAELLKQRDRLRKRPEWKGDVQEGGQVQVREYVIEYGEWKMDANPTPYTIPATEENIWALFERAGKVLGHGLHDSYANRREFRGDINTARLELHYIVNSDAEALKAVQQACEKEFDRLWKEFEEDIRSMLPAVREEFATLRRRGGKSVMEPMIVAETIEIRKESPTWDDHLYVDAKGKFGWKAKSWEEEALKIERKKPGFAGFLRNIPRKDYALCVPYGVEEDEAMFPDLIVFRRSKGGVVMDMIEPHGDHLADHLAKAKGMANYARKHGEQHFGRIEMMRFVGTSKRAERLNMQNEKTRVKVLNASSAEQLMEIYEELG
ncbi:MAG: DEAD/DEAH box helicase family protein [Tepidisphaeraceae bacterium]